MLQPRMTSTYAEPSHERPVSIGLMRLSWPPSSSYSSHAPQCAKKRPLISREDRTRLVTPTPSASLRRIKESTTALALPCLRRTVRFTCTDAFIVVSMAVDTNNDRQKCRSALSSCSEFIRFPGVFSRARTDLVQQRHPSLGRLALGDPSADNAELDTHSHGKLHIFGENNDILPTCCFRTASLN